jgi:hypothetical protein
MVNDFERPSPDFRALEQQTAPKAAAQPFQ